MILRPVVLCCLLFGGLCSASTIDVSFSACIDVLPALSPRVELGITWSGEAWSLTSGTSAVFAPGFELREDLEFRYVWEGISLSAGVDAAVVPWALGIAHASLSADLLELIVLEEDPELIVQVSAAGGATIDAGVVPFAELIGRLTMAFSSIDLTSTTTFSVLPLGLSSSLLLQVSLGTIQWGDDGYELKNTFSVQLSVIPLSLTYIQLTSNGQLGAVSVQNTLSYFGGGGVLVNSTVTLTLWEVVSVRIWSSYHSTAADRLRAGLCASVAFGDL